MRSREAIVKPTVNSLSKVLVKGLLDSYGILDPVKEALDAREANGGKRNDWLRSDNRMSAQAVVVGGSTRSAGRRDRMCVLAELTKRMRDIALMLRGIAEIVAESAQDAWDTHEGNTK
jgi:hypothetical protein